MHYAKGLVNKLKIILDRNQLNNKGGASGSAFCFLYKTNKNGGVASVFFYLK